MNRKFSLQKIILVMILIAAIFMSQLVILPRCSSAEYHAETIQALDDKKMTVMELSTAMVGASMCVAAVPGETTNPIADQIMDLTSMLMLVVGVLFLEKYLVTLLCKVAFAYVVPIACILILAAILFRWDSLKTLGIKLAVFGLIISMIIPCSVKVSESFVETYKSTVNEAIELAEEVQEEEIVIDEDSLTEKGFISSVISKVGDGVSGLVEKGQEFIDKSVDWVRTLISRFIDAVAILVITTCVIPIGLLFVILWFVKLLFGLQFNMPKENPIKLQKILKR